MYVYVFLVMLLVHSRTLSIKKIVLEFWCGLRCVICYFVHILSSFLLLLFEVWHGVKDVTLIFCCVVCYLFIFSNSLYSSIRVDT